jgi:S1-C subfamily serine protease
VRSNQTNILVSFSDGRETPGKFVLKNSGTHVALAETDTGDIAPLVLGSELPPRSDNDKPDAIIPDATVLVLGYAGSMQEGRISIGRILGWITRPDLSSDQLLVANVHTAAGFSGAPVVNTRGQVIGVAHAREHEEPNVDHRYLIASTSVIDLLSEVPHPRDESSAKG